MTRLGVCVAMASAATLVSMLLFSRYLLRYNHPWTSKYAQRSNQLLHDRPCTYLRSFTAKDVIRKIFSSFILMDKHVSYLVDFYTGEELVCFRF